MKNSFSRFGIAGYTGSGKSLLTERIAQISNAVRIDVDSFAKTVMLSDRTVLQEIATHFGEDVVVSGINFALLGERAFVSLATLATLNTIVAKPIVTALKEKMDTVGNQPIVVDAALIPYWGIEGWFDRLLWVDAPRDLRVTRLRNRTPGLSVTSIAHRVKLQEQLFLPPTQQEKWLYLTNRSTEELFYAHYDLLEGSV